MLKKTFGLIAVGAFVATVGFSAVKAKIAADTIWVHQDGSMNQTISPKCTEDNDNTCALEYLFVDGQIGAPTGGILYGDRYE